jgi:hypothetical protein
MGRMNIFDDMEEMRAILGSRAHNQAVEKQRRDGRRGGDANAINYHCIHVRELCNQSAERAAARAQTPSRRSPQTLINIPKIDTMRPTVLGTYMNVPYVVIGSRDSRDTLQWSIDSILVIPHPSCFA